MRHRPRKGRPDRMGGSVVSLWYAAAAGCTAWICYTDIRRCWIADAPVLALAVGNGAASYAGLVRPFWPVSLGVAALFLLLYGLWPGSIGSGDIKLALALAPGCPGWGAWTMAVTSFSLAALVALFYRFRTGKTIIPFGPFLLAGWWLAQEPLQRVWPGGWLW